MERKVLIANWKMNKSLHDGLSLAEQVAGGVTQTTRPVQVFIAPPFPILHALVQSLSGTKVRVAAQNCHEQSAGAFTGEVSADSLKSIGVSAVILGHSERRKYFKERDKIVFLKARKAIEQGLQVIICVGETQKEREEGRHFKVVEAQIRKTVCKLKIRELQQTLVAYEPVWAIGTGQTASPEQAGEMHTFIRSVIASKRGDHAHSVPILYGGSCNEQNAKNLFSQPNIDGGLIGGASLQASSFLAILNSF